MTNTEMPDVVYAHGTNCLSGSWSIDGIPATKYTRAVVTAEVARQMLSHSAMSDYRVRTKDTYDQFCVLYRDEIRRLLEAASK